MRFCDDHWRRPGAFQPDRLCQLLVARFGARIAEINERTWVCAGAWRTVESIDDTPIPEVWGRRRRCIEIDVVDGRTTSDWSRYGGRDRSRRAAAEALAARLAYQLGLPFQPRGRSLRWRRRGIISICHCASARYGDGSHLRVDIEVPA